MVLCGFGVPGWRCGFAGLCVALVRPGGRFCSVLGVFGFLGVCFARGVWYRFCGLVGCGALRVWVSCGV